MLPTLTNVENPSPSRLAAASAARPSAPLCEDMATRPCGGKTGANVAASRTAGSAFRSPMQLGPTSRIP